MKNPSKYIKQAIYAILGNSFSVGSDTVYFYTDAPQKPPTNYVYGTLTGYNDIGTKDKFIGSITYDLTIVTKVVTGAISSLLLEDISDNVLGQLIQRGEPLIVDTTNTFGIYSVVVDGMVNSEQMVGNHMELFQRVTLTLQCAEL